MIDLTILKDDPNRISAEVKKRGLDLDVAKLVKLDEQRRKLQAKYDTLRAEQKGAKDTAQGKALKEKLKKLEERQRAVQPEFDDLILQVPNFTADGLPAAEDRVEREVGEKPTLDNPKPHYEIPALKPHLDFERGAKVAGSRFWFLKGPLVRIESALSQYAQDFYEPRGYVLMRPPSLVRKSAMEGTGFFPAEENEFFPTKLAPKKVATIEATKLQAYLKKFENENFTGKLNFQPHDGGLKKLDVFDTTHEDLYLSGTAEVPLASYHAGENLDTLPLKYLGFAPAYRREAGSYGKDTKGIFRGHEFDKLELFIFAEPEKSWDYHEELQKDAEEFWQSLGIPFRTVTIAAQELGAPNAKKYDLEAWLPGEGKYREVASNSNDTDFQARRLGIKSGGEYVHTLNNTACAIGRTIIAIAENYQQKDGSIEMPKVLHEYLPFKRITKTGDTE